MDALQVHEIGCLIGHSLGSYAALHFAGTWPHRVSNLMLIGTTSSPADHPLVKAMTPFINDFLISILEYFPYTLAQNNVDGGIANTSDVNHWLYDTLLYESTLFSPVVFESWNLSRLTPSVTEQYISRISAQTLLIHGAMDTNTPIDLAKLMIDMLPKQCNASLQVVPGQGHAVQWTNEGARVVVAGIQRLLASQTQRDIHSDAIYQSLDNKQVHPHPAHLFLACLGGILLFLGFKICRSEKPSPELSHPLVLN